MSDVSRAPPPAAGSPPPAPASIAMETLGEAAGNRMAAIKADREFGAKVLAGDAAAINERRTLLEILHGAGDEASKAALAKSIGLEPRPTLAAAQRQSEAAAAAAEALRPNYGEFGRSLGADGLADTTRDLSTWVKSTGLPDTTSKLVLQHVADEGARLMKMSPEEKATWAKRQDDLVLKMAHGDEATVNAWRAAAKKAVAGSAFTYDTSLVLYSAYLVRTLALAGNLKK